jgi:hypothetical protein
MSISSHWPVDASSQSIWLRRSASLRESWDWTRQVSRTSVRIRWAAKYSLPAISVRKSISEATTSRGRLPDQIGRSGTRATPRRCLVGGVPRSDRRGRKSIPDRVSGRRERLGTGFPGLGKLRHIAFRLSKRRPNRGPNAPMGGVRDRTRPGVQEILLVSDRVQQPNIGIGYATHPRVIGSSVSLNRSQFRHRSAQIWR